MQPNRLIRTRLTERLARATKFPIAALIAPAGFGKTVALRDFLTTGRLDAIRYDVGREDDTLFKFAARLSEALREVAPGAHAAYAAMEQQVIGAAEPARQICDWFVVHLKRVVCTIVIDDLHFASHDPATLRFLCELIDRTCERIAWILTSPPLEVCARAF